MPSGFNVGPLTIHYYGILIMLGVIAATLLARREANRRGQNGDMVWDMLVWVLIAGILGARLWHILTPSPSAEAQGLTTYFYLTHPLDALAVWNGGLGIPGAVIGGAVGLFFFGRRHNLHYLTWLDTLAPALALGQAIGRWGNFFNQELYGAPTSLPWAIYIDPQHRLPQFETQAYYHPTFLYESIWDLGNMTLLLWLSRRFKNQLKTGDIFLAYLIVYPLGRFLLEFLRLDSSQVAGINANQAVMLMILVIASFLLVWRHRMDGKILPADTKGEITDNKPV
jgi:phosphatidylglycerol---prolipoprotein diacylglyceryl transferase